MFIYRSFTFIFIVRSSIRLADVVTRQAMSYVSPAVPPDNHTVTDVLESVIDELSTVIPVSAVIVLAVIVSPLDSQSAFDPPLVVLAKSNL